MANGDHIVKFYLFPIVAKSEKSKKKYIFGYYIKKIIYVIVNIHSKNVSINVFLLFISQNILIECDI